MPTPAPDAVALLAEQIERVPIDSIEPHPANPNQGDVGAISESIDAVGGFYNVILVQRSTNRIIAGEHRWKSLKAKGSTVAPVVRLDVDDETAVRIMVGDNEIPRRLSHPDDERLAALLTDLAQQSAHGLAGTGFDHDALDDLLASLAPRRPTGEDIIVEPPAEPVTQPGDVWELGAHRLVCGDATDPAAYDVLMQGRRAHLCLTDPPYGVGLDYGEGFSDDEETVGLIIDAFVPLAREHSDRMLVSCGSRMLFRYPEPTWVLGWFYPGGGGQCCWGFNTFQMILAYGKDPYLTRGLGARPDAYMNVSHARTEDTGDHPAPKPIAAWEWFLERGSLDRGDVILDPFGGAGTTLIVCENLGRVARLIELSPAYCDVIARRYQGVAGVVPRREGVEVDFLAAEDAVGALA